MAERLYEEIRYGMVKVTRVDTEKNTHKDRRGETCLLCSGNFHFVVFTIQGAVNVNLSLLIVSTNTNTFDEGTFLSSLR